MKTTLRDLEQLSEMYESGQIPTAKYLKEITLFHSDPCPECFFDPCICPGFDNEGNEL